MRLSTYLHHDSRDDRMALSQKLTSIKAAKPEENGQDSCKRWFLPSELFSTVCMNMIPLKQFIQQENFAHQHLARFCVESEMWLSHIKTLYYSGNYTQALSVL